MGDGVSRGSARSPQLRLDALLEELQTRVDAVHSTRERVKDLLEAVLSVGRELDLFQVLRQVLESAVVLVDAEYGALGVVDGNKLSEFLTVGLTEEEVRKIGPLPSGHGILGELIRHPEPLRLPEISGHPASYGFPPHHPPMHSFLGVPIRVRDEVFGNLYLTEKRGGREFDGEDEMVLRTLAVAAGIAIENARLYKAARDRQRWMAANAEVVRALLSGSARTDVLRAIIRHAYDILGADLGLLALPSDDDRHLLVKIALGHGAEQQQEVALPLAGSFAGVAITAGEAVTTGDIRKDARQTGEPARFEGLGPAVAVPMMTGHTALGVLLLARKEQAAPFSEAETEPLLAYAGQTALAMELAERRRAAEQLTVLEDRDRIARDLHDLAIQRLFATGMTLQSAVRFVDHPEASERLLRAVDDLDETIKIIRSTIFALRTRETGRGSQGLRSRAAAGVENAARTLGFTPALHMEGLLDTDVPPSVVEDVIGVLTEALSNVARHSRATAADVSLVVRSGTLTVTVSDNGVGLAARSHRSGLRNLAQRAQRLGGNLETATGPDGGTHVKWQVPIAPA